MAVKSKQIPPQDRPTRWFIQTHESEGRLICRLLANQWIPVADGDAAYLEGDVNYTVLAPAAKRTQHPVGTIFAIDKINVNVRVYQAEGARMVAMPPAEDSDATPEDLKAFRKYKGEKTSPEEKESIDSSKVSFLSRMKVKPEMAPPTIEKDGYYCDPDVWYLLLRNVKRRISTLLVGPTGSGKSVLLTLIAKACEMDLQSYNMGAMLDPVSGLLGTNRLVAEDGRTVSRFDYAPFAKGITAPNTIHFWDELTRMPFQGSNILFPIIDPEQRILPMDYAPIQGEKPHLEVAADSVVFAAANLGAEYTGVIPIDRALLDRLFTVELDYLPPVHESALLQKRFGISSIDADHIVSVCGTIREAYKIGEVSSSVSVRYTQETASLIGDGFSPLAALKTTILPLFHGDQGSKEFVLTTLTSK